MANEENKKETAKGFSGFLSKTADISKKAVGGIQKGAAAVTEQAKKALHEQKVKWYNPLFPEDFKKEGFTLPNVIEIVDDAVRRDIDICEGAIGWIDKVNEVEVLHLYDEWVEQSGITFLPIWKCDNVYCVDAFDRTRYVNANAAFSMANEERLAELENIAYCLGAKSCSIELVEINAEVNKAAANVKSNVADAESHSSSRTESMQSGKVISNFAGNDNPSEPALKWFAHDEGIKGLIKMRCSDANSIKSKVLVVQGSSIATISKKAACAVDKLLKIKGSMSMEKQAVKEISGKLVYEIIF